jgi:hypothetical protein
MSQAVIIGVVTLMMMMSSSMGAAFFMMGGDDEKKTEKKTENKTENKTGPTSPSTSPDPSGKCLRNVTATRKDRPNGWGMPLKFKCEEQTVTIGNSSVNSKTTVQPVNISQTACPATINKNNWLGGYTYGDIFKIDVSDCV